MSNKRKVTTEEYYTDSVLAKRLVNIVESYYDLSQFQILEPSAGYGVFLSFLPDGSKGIDINPMSPFVEKCDYFDYNVDQFDSGKKIMVIGNPPFGSRGAMAMKFLNKSMMFADVVAFILPRSFKKYTFQNRLPLNYKLIHDVDCEDFILPDGSPHKVKCSFQIWEKCSQGREKIFKKKEHPDFEMKHAHLSRISKEEFNKIVLKYPIAVSQVGENIKIVESKNLTKGSWWFILPRDVTVLDKLKRMSFDYLKNQNTLFMSLAKSDIIEAYGKV